MQTAPLNQTAPAPPRRGHAPALLLLAALTLVVFANALPGDFVFDDRTVVVKNRFVNGEESPWGSLLLPYGKNPEVSQGYRPLMILSLALDHRLGGGGPLVFHVGNLFFHLLASGALYSLLLGVGGSRRAALWGAILFCTHPLHVEVVANIVGRSELLAAAFGLLAMALHAHRGGKVLGASLAGTSLLLALLSKEHALLVPLLLGLLDLHRGTLRSRFPSYCGLASAVALFFLARILVLGSIQGAQSGVIPFLDNPVAGAPALVRMSTALVVLCRYLGLLVFPLRLSADYSHAEIAARSPGDLAVLGAAALTLALVVAGVLLLRRHLAGPGLLSFFVAFLLTGNLLIPVGTIMGERLAYLPSISLSIVLCGLLATRRGIPTGVILTVVVALLAARSAARNPDWWTERRLFGSAARTSTRSFKAHYNHALALMKAGEHDAAFEEFSTAIEIHPESAEEALVHRGNLHLMRNEGAPTERDLRQAIRDFESSSSIASDPTGFLGAGRIHLHLGEPESALPLLARAVSVTPLVGPDAIPEKERPEAIEARLLLARALRSLGRDPEALPVLDQVLAVQPGHAGAVRMKRAITGGP